MKNLGKLDEEDGEEEDPEESTDKDPLMGNNTQSNFSV